MGFKLDDVKHLLPSDQVAQIEATRKKRRMFGNTPTVYAGVRYDSKSEADRAVTLDMLMKAGEISFWLEQVKFRLGCPENTYRVDFLVFYPNGTIVAEDVKGRETEKFRHNKRLWKTYGPVPLRIIRDGYAEVVEGGKQR